MEYSTEQPGLSVEAENILRNSFWPGAARELIKNQDEESFWEKTQIQGKGSVSNVVFRPSDLVQKAAPGPYPVRLLNPFLASPVGKAVLSEIGSPHAPHASHFLIPEGMPLVKAAPYIGAIATEGLIDAHWLMRPLNPDKETLNALAEVRQFFLKAIEESQ